jgi:GNAT superfamily N-acetyltransferase
MRTARGGAVAHSSLDCSAAVSHARARVRKIRNDRMAVSDAITRERLDGATMIIRPLHCGEEGLIRELSARLSPRTRYLRFFSMMPVLPEALVHRLASVDGHRQVALVVEEDICGRVEPIALASYAAVDDTTVELAMVVRDEWQNQRIGTTLAAHVLDAAEASGFHRFVATIDSNNVAIRHLLRHVGVVVSSTFAAGVSELPFIRRPKSAQ